jgi:hypothetical protein
MVPRVFLDGSPPIARQDETVAFVSRKDTKKKMLKMHKRSH